MWLLHIRAASLTFKRLLLMNTRNLLCTIILPALLLLFTTAAFAQNKTVTGRVTDAAGAVQPVLLFPQKDKTLLPLPMKRDSTVLRFLHPLLR